MSLQSDVFTNVSGINSDAQLAAVELFKGYPDGLLTFVTASCLIIMLIGIPGNIITIIALARYKKVRNATAIFIMNLSFTDLLFCCFNLPFTASIFHHHAWIHGQLLCRIHPLIRYALMNNSMLTVFTITINRFVMIAHPKLYTKLYKKWNIIIMIAFTWMFSFGIMTFTFLEKYGRFGLDVNSGSCTIITDYKMRSPKKVIILTAFMIPCVAIILCYAKVYVIVRNATKRSINKKKQVYKEESSSSDISTSVSVRATGKPSYNYNLEPIHGTETSSRITLNPTIDRSATFNMEMSDNIIKNPEDIEKEPSRLRRFRKSMKLLKISLPTRKDKRLGTMIIALIISYCICNLPIVIIKIQRIINPVSNIVGKILYYLSTCINPVMYVVISKEYRKAYKNLFKRKKSLLPVNKKKL